MKRTRIMRLWAVLLALAAYTANGGQSHLQMQYGDSVSVLMCGLGGSHTIELTLGAPAPSDTSAKTCCGDCAPAAAALPSPPADIAIAAAWAPLKRAFASPVAAPVRSPLWPGAPPQGPPLFLTT